MVGVVVFEGICEGVFEEESLASVHGHEEFVEVYLTGLVLVQLFKNTSHFFFIFYPEMLAVKSH